MFRCDAEVAGWSCFWFWLIKDDSLSSDRRDACMGIFQNVWYMIFCSLACLLISSLKCSVVLCHSSVSRFWREGCCAFSDEEFWKCIKAKLGILSVVFFRFRCLDAYERERWEDIDFQ